MGPKPKNKNRTKQDQELEPEPEPSPAALLCQKVAGRKVHKYRKPNRNPQLSTDALTKKKI